MLTEAAAAGAQRVRSKMARAVELAAVVGADRVDQALGLAAIAAPDVLATARAQRWDPAEVLRVLQAPGMSSAILGAERIGRDRRADLSAKARRGWPSEKRRGTVP